VILLGACGAPQRAHGKPSADAAPAITLAGREDCERAFDHLLALRGEDPTGADPAMRTTFVDDCATQADIRDVRCTIAAETLGALEVCGGSK
jgi:hypothetical protein